MATIGSPVVSSTAIWISAATADGASFGTKTTRCPSDSCMNRMVMTVPVWCRTRGDRTGCGYIGAVVLRELLFMVTAKENGMSGSAYSGGERVGIDLDALTKDRERIKRTFLQKAPAQTRGRGNHHTAQISSDVERTCAFWQDLLEMPLTEMFENRDLPGSTHFFFDIGAGNLIAYFDLPGLELEGYKEVLGGHHHIAISVTKESWDHLRAKLDDAGVDYQLVSRDSIYFRGPDGERLELLANKLGEMYGTKVL